MAPRQMIGEAPQQRRFAAEHVEWHDWSCSNQKVVMLRRKTSFRMTVSLRSVDLFPTKCCTVCEWSPRGSSVAVAELSVKVCFGPVAKTLQYQFPASQGIPASSPQRCFETGAQMPSPAKVETRSDNLSARRRLKWVRNSLVPNGTCLARIASTQSCALSASPRCAYMAAAIMKT